MDKHRKPKIGLESVDGGAERLVRVNGEGSWITIAGYGSLLSKESATKSCPSLTNFRVGVVKGFVRVFNLISVHCQFSELGWSTKEVASIVARPCASGTLVCSLFDIPLSELSNYLQREYKYKFDVITAHNLNDPTSTLFPVLICTEFNQEGIEARYGGKEPYERDFGSLLTSPGSLWRTDILPQWDYLVRCLQYAKDLDRQCFDNFLDQVYIADGKTTIREYLKTKQGYQIDGENSPFT